MSKFLPSQAMTSLKANAGTRETATITMPAVGAATQADYVVLYNADGTSKAVFIDIDSAGTEPTGALYVAATSKTSIAYKNAVQETYTVTFPAFAAMAQADYFVIYDEVGAKTAVWFDKDNAGTVPTGALYVASATKIQVDIVTGDTAAQVATKAYTAMNGNVTNVSFVDNLDGTITVTLDNAGPATNAVPKNANDSGAGSITIGSFTNGVTATTAIAGGALLAAVTLSDSTLTDNGDGTVAFADNDIGNATNVAVKNANDSTAGSITASVSNGSAISFPYETPASSPTARKVNPDLV